LTPARHFRHDSLVIQPTTRSLPCQNQNRTDQKEQVGEKRVPETMMNYDRSKLPTYMAAYLDANDSTISPGDDLDLFFHCWIKPNCEACLSPANEYPCSWCATSQACVPNTVFEYPFGILSPIQSSEICPLAWRERWEMRARPFSCRCSTMTFISVVVAVLATLLGVLLLWLVAKLGRWTARRWRARRQGWWKVRWMRTARKDASTETEPNIGPTGDERTPLLA